MEDNESSLAARNSSRSQRRRRPTYGSSESADSVFSQQFSQLIGLARQNRDVQLDDDVMVSNHQLSSNSYRPWSRRVHSSHSETDNESIDFMDTLFGETDSHISFGGYGDDSDASVDRHSMIERETPSPLDYESRAHSDTDIDPMHAGIDQWTLDDPSEYGEWEGDSTRDPLLNRHNRDTPSPNGSATSPQILWRGPNIDLFTGFDEIDLSPFTGNSGDYMDAQGFEDLLEQLAEADISRIGAPPAAASSLQNLPHVIISKDHEKNGTLICAVCKDSLSIDSEARQLPCSHLYHPSCIFPWLRKRNSCPVCRYELPTDDPKYEKGKQNNARHQGPVDESYSDGTSDVGDEANEPDDTDGNVGAAGGPNRGGNGRWLLIVAAPIVAVVGIVIAAWVQNSSAGGRIRIFRTARDCNVQHSHRSHGAGVRENRSSSWWSFY